jgi:hypothetical protein
MTRNSFRKYVYSKLEYALSLLLQIWHCETVFSKWGSMSFNKTQSRVVIGLPTGHSTLRRHLHLMGLNNSPLCRSCGAEDETSAHILSECVALASLRHVYLGSYVLDPQDIKSLSLAAIWNLVKEQGSPELVSDSKAQRARF